MVIPIGMAVSDPAMPTIGDTIPADTMEKKPNKAEALPARWTYLAIAIEKLAAPNRETIPTVKNRIVVTTRNGIFRIIAPKKRIEPIHSTLKLNCNN